MPGSFYAEAMKSNSWAQLRRWALSTAFYSIRIWNVSKLGSHFSIIETNVFFTDLGPTLFYFILYFCQFVDISRYLVLSTEYMGFGNLQSVKLAFESAREISVWLQNRILSFSEYAGSGNLNFIFH